VHLVKIDDMLTWAGAKGDRPGNDDVFGMTVLGPDPDGSGALWWYASRWSDIYPERPATEAEIIESLWEELQRLRAELNKEEPYARLGRAVARVLPAAKGLPDR